mmetsp:Transcript_2127/g.3126  ORF Transcript_2127/g.3126 Transcript_2127/m.3126 type:complete len:113 (-) Transcript_2127:642-980(-)
MLVDADAFRGRMFSTAQRLSSTLRRRDLWQIICRHWVGSSRRKNLWWKAPESGPLVTCLNPHLFNFRVNDGYLHDEVVELEALDDDVQDSGKYFGKIFSARISGWTITNDRP